MPCRKLVMTHLRIWSQYAILQFIWLSFYLHLPDSSNPTAFDSRGKCSPSTIGSSCTLAAPSALAVHSHRQHWLYERLLGNIKLLVRECPQNYLSTYRYNVKPQIFGDCCNVPLDKLLGILIIQRWLDVSFRERVMIVNNCKGHILTNNNKPLITFS